MEISRRALLLGMGAAPFVITVQGAQRRPARPKLAAVCTTYFKYSHAQHIVDRFLEGYGWNGTHHRPEMDLVSIYIDQVDANDVSKTRLVEFPAMTRYPTSSRSNELPPLVTDPIACVVDYRDGLRGTVLILNGAVKDFTFAARVKGSAIQSTQFLVTPPPSVTSYGCLVRKIEELFEPGKAPYPIERSLLAHGIFHSQSGPTPHLDVRYRAPQQSQHART